MRIFYHLFFLLLSFVVFSGVGFSLSDGYIYFDDGGDTNVFDNGTLPSDTDPCTDGGWTVAGTCTYSDGDGVGGSMAIKSISGVNYGAVFDFDSYPSEVTMEVDFRYATDFYTQFGFHQTTNTYYALFGSPALSFRANGLGDTGIGNTALYVGNAWHNMKIIYHGDNTMTTYINDSQIDTGTRSDVAIDRFYLGSSGSGTMYVDNFMVYDGATPPVSAISNSSWNATSSNVLGNRTEWNVGGFVNVSSNLLSLTVTTNLNTNASCNIGNDLNYTSMVALANGSNYKFATTSTTSHSYTLYDNFSVGSRCLYCSFIATDDASGEGENSHSGCLNLTRTDVPTAIKSIQFNISNQIISDTAFTTIALEKFNTSQTEDLIIFNALNIEKLTGGGTNGVNLRLLIDGSSVKNEVVRTVSTVGDIGSAGLSPTKVNVPSGEHNLTLQASRTATGSINLSNIDLILMIGSSSDDDNQIKVNITDITGTHSNNAYEEVFNFTMDKFVTSENLLFWRITSTKTTSGNSEISYLMRDSDGELSPIASRLLDSATDVGSMAMCHIDDEESADHTHTLLGKQTDAGDTVTINGSIFDMDLRDSANHLVGSFDGSHAGTNDTTTISLGAGTHVLTNGSLITQVGTSVLITGSVSFQSTSGVQTPLFTLAVGDQSSEKERYLADNDDIGNVFLHEQIYSALQNNVTASLSVTIATGETLTIRDESITGLEANTFSIEEIGLPPIPAPFITPANNSVVVALTSITWLPFSDANDNLDNCSLNLYTDTFVFNESIENTTAVDTSSSFNFSTINEDYYRMIIQCWDDTGFYSNSSIRVQNVYLDPVVVNNTAPANDSSPTESLAVSFAYDVNFATTCTLRLNATDNVSMSASVGGNTFPSVTVENLTYSWTVNCANASISGESGAYLLNMNYQPPAVKSIINNQLGTSQCPDTIPHALMIFIFVIVIVIIYVYSQIINMAVLEFIAVVMIFAFSWVVIGCSFLLGLGIVLTGVLLLVRMIGKLLIS